MPVGGVFVLMVLIGLVMEANFYPLVVIAQDAVPRHVGFASGVMLGLSIGVGALATTLLGVIADHAGLANSLRVVAAFAMLAALAAMWLPRDTT
jgi:MFS transporter, FSR family, fosmidomycin resistance protein